LAAMRAVLMAGRTVYELVGMKDFLTEPLMAARSVVPWVGSRGSQTVVRMAVVKESRSVDQSVAQRGALWVASMASGSAVNSAVWSD